MYRLFLASVRASWNLFTSVSTVTIFSPFSSTTDGWRELDDSERLAPTGDERRVARGGRRKARLRGVRKRHAEGSEVGPESRLTWRLSARINTPPALKPCTAFTTLLRCGGCGGLTGDPGGEEASLSERSDESRPLCDVPSPIDGVWTSGEPGFLGSLECGAATSCG